jgi:hypothetical protein
MDPKELPFTVNRSFFRFVATSSKRIYSRSALYLMAVLTAAFLFGCDAFYGNASKNTEKSGGTKTMDMIATTKKRTAEIPAIDAAAPLQTATATFALG